MEKGNSNEAYNTNIIKVVKFRMSSYAIVVYNFTEIIWKNNKTKLLLTLCCKNVCCLEEINGAHIRHLQFCLPAYPDQPHNVSYLD